MRTINIIADTVHRVAMHAAAWWPGGEISYDAIAINGGLHGDARLDADKHIQLRFLRSWNGFFYRKGYTIDVHEHLIKLVDREKKGRTSIRIYPTAPSFRIAKKQRKS